MILEGAALEFYKWDGDVKQKLEAVREKLNDLADTWSREQKDRCLDETQSSFKVRVGTICLSRGSNEEPGQHLPLKAVVPFLPPPTSMLNEVAAEA